MRIVFFGTGEFAVPALHAIRNFVVLAVTQPDRPSGRGLAPKPSPFKKAALELGIELAAPDRARAPEFVAQVRDLRADALVVAAYGQLLSEELLQAAPRGGINLHGSILPKYRGAAPIQRALLDGETETGVTLMQMDRGMDTGDVIDVVRTAIGPDETYGELQERLAALAAAQIADWLPRIVSGDYPRSSQPSQGATIAPKVRKEEAELSCGRSAIIEFNRFRAFTPNPGSFLAVQPDGAKPAVLRLHKIAMNDRSGPNGTILDVSPFPVVAFAEGSLELLEVQPEGKKRMSGRDWANGLRLRSGQIICHG